MLLLLCGSLGLLASVYGRVVPAWDTVMAGDTPRLLDTDSYYHLRHTQFAAEHFPSIQRWDVGTHYPLGERSPHAGLFNQVLAALALLVGGGQPGEKTLLGVMAWAPVLLHVVATLLLFGLARRLLGLGPAVMAVWIFVLFPGLELPRTFLGFADHHAAEVALLVATAWGLAASLEYHAAGPRPAATTPLLRIRRALAEARFALPLLIFQITWSGAPLVIALVALSLCLVAAVDVLRDFDASASARTARDFGAVLVIGTSAIALLSPETIMIRELLLPIVAGSAGLALVGALALWLLPRAAATGRGRRAALGVLLALGGVCFLALQLVPARFLELLLEPKSELIAEQQAVSVLGFVRLQGLPGVLGVLAPLLVGRSLLRATTKRGVFAVTCLATLATLNWLAIRDYGYGPPVLLALACAAAGRELWVSRSRPWVMPVALGVSALQIWPLGLAHGPFNSVPTPLLQVNSGWFEAMAWLRRVTPRPALAVDAAVAPWAAGVSPFPMQSYGVLSSWEFGNFVAALGQRTPLRSHGMSDELARWLLLRDEEQSVVRACPTCTADQRVRYVVLSSPTLAEHFMTTASAAGADLTTFHGTLGEAELNGRVLPLRTYGELYEQTIAARLYLADANGLARYRLVYASATRSLLSYRMTFDGDVSAENARFVRISSALETSKQRAYAERLPQDALHLLETDKGLVYDHRVLSSVKIFELVPGARLVGRAWPHSSLTIFLGLKVVTTGQELVYRRSVGAEADGSFELLLPYSSAGASEVVVATAPIQLLAVSPDGERRVVGFEVAEQAVQSGEHLRLGDLRDAPSNLASTPAK